jgi:hypothetical protein
LKQAEAKEQDAKRVLRLVFIEEQEWSTYGAIGKAQLNGLLQNCAAMDDM